MGKGDSRRQHQGGVIRIDGVWTGRPREPSQTTKRLNSEVARPKRFELLTPRFVVWCSIQLSYGRGGV